MGGRVLSTEVVPDELDKFSLSELGRSSLELDQTYSNPMKFVQFRLHDPSTGKVSDSDLIPFEAMLELARRGWSHERRNHSRKMDPYKPGGAKKWYYSKTICKYYLAALLRADKLFELGLTELFHYQPAAYYRTLMFMMKFPNRLNHVRPWQNRAYYVLQQQHATRQAHGNNSTPNWDMEAERGQGKV